MDPASQQQPPRVLSQIPPGTKGLKQAELTLLPRLKSDRGVTSQVMADILCIGTDEISMQGKQSVLEKAGHTVSIAKDVRQVLAACSGIQFDVILIGQALPGKEKLRVRELLSNHCGGAKIVEQHAAGPELPAADAHIPAGQSNEDLIATIERLVPQRPSA